MKSKEVERLAQNNVLLAGCVGVRHFSQIPMEEFTQLEGHEFMLHKSNFVVLSDGSEVLLQSVLDNPVLYNLINADFSFCVLDGVDFSGCDLTGAKFVNSFLKNISFRDSRLESVDMARATLESVEFYNCSFVSCNFTFSSWYDCVTENTQFISSFLYLNVLEDCVFSQILFSSTDLNVRVWNNLRLEKIELESSDISSVGVLVEDVTTEINMLIGQCLNLTGFNFSKLDFPSETLEYSDITACDFTGLDLSNFSLEGIKNDFIFSKDVKPSLPKEYSAVFLDVDKYKIFGPYMNYSECDLSGLLISDVSLVASNFQNTNFKNAVLLNLDFTSSDLSGADFTGAIVENCTFENISFLPKVLPDGYCVCGQPGSYSLVKIQ